MRHRTNQRLDQVQDVVEDAGLDPAMLDMLAVAFPPPQAERLDPFPVADREIPWAGSAPVSRIEDADPLALTGDELVGHIYELVAELRAVRLALSVAVAKLAEVDAARLAVARSYERLRREWRAGRN